MSLGLKGRLWGASAAALLGLSFGLATAIGPAEADKVGVAAAVNPDAFSSLAGAPQSQLNIGKSIFFNERINTTTNGLVQVLLVDGSTFTVGPGSDLVIDKFVYDPKKGTGQIAASMTKGVMRFVGGKISKNEDSVKVDTPAGALAIRGGMFQMQVNGSKIVASFLFGKQLTLGGKYTVYEPGYTIDTSQGAPTIRPTTSADIKLFMASLTNGNTGGTGSTGDKKESSPNASSAFQQTLSDTADEIVNEATQTQIQDTVQEQQKTEGDPPPPPDNTRILTRAFSYPGFGTGTVSHSGILGGDPHQDADDFPVLANLNEGETRVTGDFAIHNKTDDFDETVTGTFDFPVAFQEGACNEFGVCVVDGEDAAVISGTGSVNGAFEAVLRGSAVVKPGFAAYELFPQVDPLDIDTTEFPSSGSTFEQRIWMANAFRAASGFTNANLNDPMLVIAGQKYTMPQSDQLYEFSLYTDPRQSLSFTTYDENEQPVTTILQNFVAPFATLEGSPIILGNGADVQVSTLKVLANGGNGVWLQTSFYLDDTFGTQESQVVVALGESSPNQGLTGERRGGAQFSAIALPTPNDGLSSYDTDIPVSEQERIAYTGDIATIAGANGAHFLGTGTPNIVIGTDTTNGNSPFLDKPLSDNPNDGYQSATYHIGTGKAPQAAPEEQASGTYLGYAAGIARTIGGENGDEGALLVSNGPEDVKIVFDAARNTLSAQVLTHVMGDDIGQEPCDVGCPTNEAKGGMTLVLGDPADNNAIEGRSAFIDNKHYAAIETPGASTVQSGHGDHPLIDAPTGYLVSGEQLGVDNVLLYPTLNPQTNQVEMAPGAFCKNCDFLTWGAWGARAGFVDPGYTDTYTDGNGQEHPVVVPPSDVTADAQLGWYVAGDVIDDVEGGLPFQGNAYYSGHALGNVANNLNDQGWTTYVATGNMDMSWNFGERSGQLNITDFDRAHIQGGLDFGGTMSMPGVVNNVVVPQGGPNAFTGTLAPLDPNCLPNNLADLSGSANGSFVGATKLPNNLEVPGNPKGVIGNWNIGNQAYKATGIFGGSLATPH